MKKIRRSRRVLAGMLAVMMVAGAAPINLGSVGLFNTTISASAGDYAHFRPEVGNVTLHDDNSVQSITVKWQWPYGTGCNGVVMTSKPIYRTGEYVSYYGGKSTSLEDSEKNIDWETAGNKDETRSNILKDMELIDVYGSGSEPYMGSQTFEFEKGEVPIDKNDRLYFYLWTYSSGSYYPDFQLAMLDINEMKVYYGQEETLDENGNVIWTQVKFSSAFEASEGLTYNGDAQALVNISPSSAEGVTPKYAITDSDVSEAPAEDSELWQDSCTATDAGTYRVWYKTSVTEESDYKPYEPAYSDVTIEKADPVFTAPTANELTEDGTVQELITTSDCDGGDMLFAMTTDAETTPDEDAFGDEIPTADESGTYYVWYKVKGDKNHNDSEPACIPVTVAEGNWLIGDVNNDGKINVTDIAMAAAHVKGKRMLTKDKFKRADVNFDGVLDVSDITLIAAHVKGKKMLLQKNEIPQTEEKV